MISSCSRVQIIWWVFSFIFYRHIQRSCFFMEDYFWRCRHTHVITSRCYADIKGHHHQHHKWVAGNTVWYQFHLTCSVIDNISAQHSSVHSDVNRSRQAVTEAPATRRSVYIAGRPEMLFPGRQRQHQHMKMRTNIFMLHAVLLLCCFCSCILAYSCKYIWLKGKGKACRP